MSSFFRRLSGRSAAQPATPVPGSVRLGSGEGVAPEPIGSNSRPSGLLVGFSSERKRNGVAKRAQPAAPVAKEASPEVNVASMAAAAKSRQEKAIPNLGSYREQQFAQLLAEDIVDLERLRALAWNGVPPEYRSLVWKLILGYVPSNMSRRPGTLKRKRREYAESVPLYFDIPDQQRTTQEQDLLRQILVDVPRTAPGVPLFHHEIVHRCMERILYIWAIRHPASGYVQGINDLVTPFFLVFLSGCLGENAAYCDIGHVDTEVLDEVEADTYWCVTKLLDAILDHYTEGTPGLTRMCDSLDHLTRRIDRPLAEHFEVENLRTVQFAFRWMNCLLMRELNLAAIIRIWDTYLSEKDGFEAFHTYVCATLLCHFSDDLRNMKFQDLVLFLQDLPIKEWGEEEIEPLLSQAFILSQAFTDAKNHLS